VSAPPTSRAHARPPCGALYSCHPNRPLRGFVANAQRFGRSACCTLRSLSCCRRLSAVLMPTLPPCRLSCLPRSYAVHPASLPGPARLLSSRRHTPTLHAGTSFFMSALNFCLPVRQVGTTQTVRRRGSRLHHYLHHLHWHHHHLHLNHHDQHYKHLRR
jgi:hypothetical protein